LWIVFFGYLCFSAFMMYLYETAQADKDHAAQRAERVAQREAQVVSYSPHSPLHCTIQPLALHQTFHLKLASVPPFLQTLPFPRPRKTQDLRERRQDYQSRGGAEAADTTQTQ
jgi:hypothetical protein